VDVSSIVVVSLFVDRSDGSAWVTRDGVPGGSGSVTDVVLWTLPVGMRSRHGPVPNVVVSVRAERYRTDVARVRIAVDRGVAIAANHG
jgi:hypothetical protein